MQVDFATTTIPTILLWGLGLLIFLIGGAIGYFNINLDANKKFEESEQKIQTLKAEADRRIADANKKLEEARALEAEFKKAPAIVEAPSLLRLKSDDGLRVQIDMDGQPLTAPLTPDRRKRLIELLSHIRPWLEGGVVESQPVKPIAPPPVVSKPVTKVPPPPVPRPVTPTSVVPAEVKPVPLAISLAPNKPKPDPELEFKLLSMVQQIDRVLQTHIAGTPLAEIGLSLQDTLQGGLEVHIGSTVYETIDDVPDANIKATIRAAIAEWEQKYVPGAS